MDAFGQLLVQIDAFIRKYYKNQMIKGSILVAAVLLFTFLLVATLEYVGRFGSTVRGLLLFSFLFTNGFLLVRYFAIPLLKLFAIGKLISREQASALIGSFFPEISDRILNTLQLNQTTDNHSASVELVRASIEQRSRELSVVPFSSGIDLRKNWNYVKYASPVVVLFILTLVFFPEVVTKGSKRVVLFQEQFKEDAPFEFVLRSSLENLEEGSAPAVEVMLRGKQLPEKVYVHSTEGNFLMKRISKNGFRIQLPKLAKSTRFYFEAGGFVSGSHWIKIVPKTTVGKFTAELKYPAYLGLKNEVIQHAGDLEVPEGTSVKWSSFAANVEQTTIELYGRRWVKKSEGFSFSTTAMNDGVLSLSYVNRFSKKVDSAQYRISVVKDFHPTISVIEEVDTLSSAIRFFQGQVGDDYGLTKLVFVYTIRKKNGKEITQRVPVTKVAGTSYAFTHAVDFRREAIEVDDKIEYYFTVYDNDGVRGPKASSSSVYTYELPSLEQLNELREEKVEASKEQLNQLIRKAAEFRKNVERMKKEALNSKSSSYSKKNQVQQLQQEQMNLMQSVEQLKQQMNESLDEKNKLSEMDLELLEKQELLEKLLNEVMDKELMDLLKQLEELMEKQGNQNLPEKLDQLEMKSEDMKKQLDRSLELLKRMQVNEKLDDIQKELEGLSKEQEDLKKKVEEQKLSNEQAKEEQEKINDKFDALKKDLEELNDLNQSLDKPMNLGDQEELKKEISENLQDSKENLEKNKSKKAGESQQKSADGMESLANQLEKMQQEANKQQQEEDINSLRQILESLMALSFRQEDVMNRFYKVKDQDPFYKKLGRRQRSIVDDTKIVRDSLERLASRQPKIATFIDQELSQLELNFKAGLENIDEHKRQPLNQNLQYVMTAFNNLALLLNESLQQMQSQMNSDMKGAGACSNPGGSGKKPSSSGNSQDMKETLKKQLEQMKKGQNPGGQMPGDKPGQGQEGSGGFGNKEFAKMAAQQTAIRQRLEQIRNELNQDGKGNGNKLNPLIKELEQQEKELLNKQLTPEMVKRQQNIMTRLLESEKALLERDFDEKRESKEGKIFNYSNQKRIDEYNQQKLKQVELLRGVDPLYRKYYKDKAAEYFNRGL